MNKISKRAWSSWIIVTLFLFYQYILRVLPSILIDDIQGKFCVDCESFGSFSGIYYLSYAFVHIPVGIMLDRFGPKYILIISMLCCSIGILPIVYSDLWVMCVIGRLILGAGSAVAVLGLFKIIRLNFPVKKFGSVLSVSVTIGLLGAVYGGSPLQMLRGILDWESIVAILSLVGVVLALCTLILIPNYSMSGGMSFKESLLDCYNAIKVPYVLSSAIFGAFMVGPLEGFADVWGATFLREVYALDMRLSVFLPSLIFFGMCFGSPLLAYIGEKTNKYSLILRLCALFMAGLFIILLLFKVEKFYLYILFFSLGILSAYQVILMHINTVRVSEDSAGIVAALTNMIVMLFGYVFHNVIGTVVKVSGEYGLQHSYKYGIAIIPLFLIIAFIGLYGEKMHRTYRRQITI